MASENPLTDSASGYLSPDSKRRFTLVAGILGAVFFVAQFVLRVLVMFLLVMPSFMSSAARTADVERSVVWRGELWFVERSFGMQWSEASPAVRRTLRHVRLSDLASAGPAVPIDLGEREEELALLPVADRLWLIGTDALGCFDGAGVVRAVDVPVPRRGSRPFAYQGRPSVITLVPRPGVASLYTEEDRAVWRSSDLPLNLPPERGPLRTVQALESGGRLLLFAELCTAEPERCSIAYREPGAGTWLPVVEDSCSCATWSVLEVAGRTGVVVSERGRQGRLSAHWLTATGVEHERITSETKFADWSRWRALSIDDRLILVAESMPGSMTLAEVAGGRVVRSARTKGGFPFGPRTMALMMIPQLLPIVLSLVLALVLTSQMRRHRVGEYAYAGQRRRFASLWQRALAQLVDAVGLAAGFLLPFLWVWRLFSDPETFIERGPAQMLWVFAWMGAALLSCLAVLTAYSYWEGVAGKTPGKWLLGIRVLGADLQPCGFGRALLRNLLTFVDGFFNFLVGVLLVALTENWQRLGDLAARTIVVVDDKAGS